MSAHDPETSAEAETGSVPCVEVLLANTLAVLTGHARACCVDHRNLMAAKTASNLMQLSQHPLLSEGFRSVAFSLHQQWVQNEPQTDARPAAAPAQVHDAPAYSRALWHTTPETIQ